MCENTVQFTFERTEKKYVMTGEQYAKLIYLIRDRIKPDEYGEYTICNIYFDTENFSLVRNSLEKPPFKEKLRLRSYGVPNHDSLVFLEIKRKLNSTVYKRRAALTYDDMMKYLSTGEHPQGSGQVFSEIDYFMKFYKPIPKVFLAYDRSAFVGADDAALRITFDTDIRSRNYELELIKGDRGEPLTDKGERIMEIKTENAMPVWLCDALTRCKIYPTSFSKYGNVYANKIYSGKGEYICSQA